MAPSFSFLFMTNRPPIAAYAEAAGVDWIFVDLERRGKAERQSKGKTIISYHSLRDVEAVRCVLCRSRLLVRINPLYENSAQEVEDAIRAGCDGIMLPMLSMPEEVERFVDMVRGRVVTWLLLETAAAVVRAEEIVRVRGVDRVHVGLNDLHLSLRLTFMYESLAGGVLDHVARIVREVAPHVVFGFGGGARVSEAHPVPPADVLREHARLGSRAVILSRTFHMDPGTVEELRARMDLRRELEAIQAVLDEAQTRTPEEVERDRQRIHARIWAVARQMRA